jgi:1,4-alpha-glucan branching enzyme
MKKILLLWVTLCACLYAFAQVRTTPTFITTDYTGEFSIIYDAKQGDGGMIGAADCYAHTGVITTDSKGDGDWKHAPKWGDNSDKYKMESIGNDLWKLTITGGMQAFYSLNEGEVVTKLAFVFRNKAGSQEGKTAGGSDILYELYPSGTLLVAITNPAKNSILAQDSVLNVTGEASAAMEILEISVTVGENTEMLTTEENTNVLQTNYTITQTGNITFTITGTDAEGKTYTDSNTIYVKGPDVDKDIPEGLLEGINYLDENTVGLVFRAPHNQSIYVLGDFNNWELNEDFHMYRDSIFDEDKNHINTLFWCTFDVEDPTKKYAFQYLVDGEKKISDPYSTVVLDPWNDKYIKASLLDSSLPAYPAKGDGVVSILQITDPKPYQWQVTDFQAPNKEDLVIYELLVRDFDANSNLIDVIGRLDYIKDLGVNAIELMPITEFDGNDSWGYSPNHFFAYDKAYGSEKIYKRFIDECHKRGIAVIVDMVFNHATGICPFAKLYWEGNATANNNPWFNRVAKHPFNVFHDINHEYEGTRQYFKRVLAFWLEEYKLDGYRMDLTKGFTQKNTGNDAGKWSQYDASRIAILKDYYDAVKETKENAYFILEHLADYKEEKELADYGMMPWRNMNNSYNQAAKGDPASSHFVDSNGKGGMFADNWVGYAESHDEERNMYIAKTYGLGDLKTNEEARMARVPALIAFSQLLPGPKMLWQYGELGYDYSINYCQGGNISDDCRTGRKPNPWTLGWQKNQARMNAYKGACKVINLRTQHPAFFRDNTVRATNCNKASWNEPRRIDVKYVKPQDDPLAEDDINIIILANFSATNTVSTSGNFPNTGVWYNYMTGEQITVSRTSKTLRLKPGELLILTSRHLDNDVAIEEAIDNENGCMVFPTITNDLITVVSAEVPDAIQVYSLTGNLVASNQQTETVSLAHVQKGTYLVRVQLGEKVSTHKIIKQ